MKIEYMPRAIRQLRKFSHDVAGRILKKMDWYVSQTKPLSFAEKLTDPKYGTYRFRIGDYRALCDLRKEKIEVLEVLSVKHRGRAYDDI